MIYLRLFLSFVKIGFTSFGGLSLIPVINQEMLTNGWMNPHEISDIIAIAEMTPGSLGINCATFAGMRTVCISVKNWCGIVWFRARRTASGFCNSTRLSQQMFMCGISACDWVSCSSA